MEKDNPYNPSPLQGLICTVFGHDYMITTSSDENSEFQCALCQKQVSDVYLDNLKTLNCRIQKFKRDISFFL